MQLSDIPTVLAEQVDTHTQQLVGDADDLSTCISTISTTRVSHVFYWFINQSINQQTIVYRQTA